MKPLATAALAVALGATLSDLHAGAPPLTADNLDAVVAAVLPTEKESAWLAVPWLTDLHEARRQAAAQHKPVFLWEMDGHPLGCT